MNYTRERVVTAKGAKNVYSNNVGTSVHISLLCCVSAAGSPLLPMVIYSKLFPGGQYRFDGPDDALYAKSVSLIDGHKSDITLDAIDLCQENNVIMFCLTPHTTHALQTLDISVFKSLKERYAKAIRNLSFSKMS